MITVNIIVILINNNNINNTNNNNNDSVSSNNSTGDSSNNSYWLRTNGVNTDGAAAKVHDCDRLREKVRPGTFGKIREYPKSTPVNKT